jgi:hypothetical protein
MDGLIDPAFAHHDKAPLHDQEFMHEIKRPSSASFIH